MMVKFPLALFSGWIHTSADTLRVLLTFFLEKPTLSRFPTRILFPQDPQYGRKALLIMFICCSCGDALQVQWELSTVRPHKSDWIGIFTKDGSSYLKYKWTRQASVGADYASGLVTFSAEELKSLVLCYFHWFLSYL